MGKSSFLPTGLFLGPYPLSPLFGRAGQSELGTLTALAIRSIALAAAEAEMHAPCRYTLPDPDERRGGEERKWGKRKEGADASCKLAAKLFDPFHSKRTLLTISAYHQVSLVVMKADQIDSDLRFSRVSATGTDTPNPDRKPEWPRVNTLPPTYRGKPDCSRWPHCCKSGGTTARLIIRLKRENEIRKPCTTKNFAFVLEIAPPEPSMLPKFMSP